MDERSFTGQEWSTLSRNCVRPSNFDGLRGAQVGIGLPNRRLKVVVRIVVADCRCTMMIWVWRDEQEKLIVSGKVEAPNNLIDLAAINRHLTNGSDPMPYFIQQLEELVTRVAQNEDSWAGLFRNLKVKEISATPTI